jgi:hypothetical protein
MRLPRPLRERFSSRGSLLTLPALAVLAGIGVWALKWWGLFVLAEAMLLGLVAELWRESLRLEDSEAEGREAVDSERDTRLRAEGRASEAERRAEAADARSDRLAAQLRDVQTAADATDISIGRLIHVLASHADEIELVRKHRALRDRVGALDWAAVSITRTEDALQVTAHVPSDGGVLVGEPVCLMDNAQRRAVGTSVVSAATEHKAEASFRLSDLGASLPSDLSANPIVPDGYSLRLSGLQETTVYASVSDERLEAFAQDLRAVADQASRIVVPAERGKAPEEEE